MLEKNKKCCMDATRIHVRRNWLQIDSSLIYKENKVDSKCMGEIPSLSLDGASE